MIGKPPSVEAPPSDKSEDHFDGDRRGADNIISDENPPSNDQDTSSKRMSADEFSPPAPLDKLLMLSPIKSPNKKTSLSAAEKLRAKNHEQQSMNYINKYDKVKTRERKSSQSVASPDVSVSDSEKTKKRAGRKPRPKPSKSPAFNSDSDSEIDVVNTSRSPIKSPHKSLAQKSQPSSSNLRNSLCSSSNSIPLTSPARKKDAKSDKHLQELDRVKLKPSSVSGVLDKPSVCDNSKAASKPSRNSKDPSVEQILDSFPGALPLSPLPNYPSSELGASSAREKLLKAGLAISPVKPHPFNGNISWVKGVPSIPVKIDLNLLDSYLCVDKRSSNFLKPQNLTRSESAKQPLEVSAKSNLPNSVNRSQNKVLKDANERNLSSSSPFRTKSANEVKSANSKSKEHAASMVARKDINKSVSNTSSETIPAFDLLPQRKPVDHTRDSSESGDSSSGSSSGSDSSADSDSDHEASNPHPAPKPISPILDLDTAPVTTPSHKSPRDDAKKRKQDSSRPDDAKRRKLVSSSPHRPLTVPSR